MSVDTWPQPSASAAPGLSWSSNGPSKAIEQTILETALLIVKWGSKGCSGGRRRGGGFRLVSIYQSLFHVTIDTLTSTTPEAVPTAPYTGSDTQQVLRQCLGVSLITRILKPTICFKPMFLFLILKLHKGRSWLLFAVMPSGPSQCWVQETRVGSHSSSVSELWATIPAPVLWHAHRSPLLLSGWGRRPLPECILLSFSFLNQSSSELSGRTFFAPSICGHYNYMSELCTWSWPSQQLDEVQVILPILQMRTLRPREVVNECIQEHSASRRQI